MSITGLEELTQYRRTLREIPVIYSIEDGHIKREYTESEIVTTELHSNKGVIVFQAVLKKGAAFPTSDTYHEHDGCREVLAIYSGRLRVEFPEKESIVLTPVNDALVIAADDPHRVYAEEETHLIAIIHPREIGV